MPTHGRVSQATAQLRSAPPDARRGGPVHRSAADTAHPCPRSSASLDKSILQVCDLRLFVADLAPNFGVA